MGMIKISSLRFSSMWTFLFLILVLFVWQNHALQSKYKFKSNDSEYLEILWKSECWDDGEWVRNMSTVPLFISHHGEHNSCKKYLDYDYFVDLLKWRWEPTSKCDYKIPTKTSFCDQLNGRNILIVGDSLNWELYSTIYDFTKPNGPQLPSQFHIEPTTICDNRSKILYKRNDKLTLVDQKNAQLEVTKDNFVMHSWIDHMTSGEYNIIIVNRGSHYVNDTDLLSDIRSFLPVFKEYVDKHDMLLFYRNSVPGHANCNKYTAPVKDVIPKSHNRVYNWDKFDHQNRILENAFQSIKGLIVDAYSPTIFRPDQHIGSGDCLHYCIPGPVDTWMIFFYNLLRLADS